jgi:antitoxin FitA
MLYTCIYAQSMSVMIQIRNVPDAVHRKLKARAAEAGMSLSDYLLADLRKSAERPTPAELQERLRSRSSVTLPEPAARIVRAERDGR